MCPGMVDRFSKSNMEPILQRTLLATYVILTPEGNVASSTHIGGSWVGLSERSNSCGRMRLKRYSKLSCTSIIQFTTIQ